MKSKIDLQYIITLLHLPKIKRKTAYKLILNLNRDINSLADVIEYVSVFDDTKWVSLLSISHFETALQTARQILLESAANNIQIVSLLDENYPRLLKTTYDPPVILNYIGNIDSLNKMPTIAIIGTRNPSAFGTKYSKHVADFFARKGFNVVSGLAKGCDTAAHLGALNANGATCAVLAHGLDKVYPKENKALAERVKNHGVIISEYFICTPMTKKNFIERDRIQAALSLGVFIIECDVNSGTMHTANYAISYNRILACMKPPLENYNETNVRGNLMLSQAGKAIAVFEYNELEELSLMLSS